MKIAWQTWVMVAIGAAQFALAQTLANSETLGLKEVPWLLLVVLPTAATLLTLAANQLKPIGGEAPKPSG